MASGDLRRGDVVWGHLDPVEGSEQGGRRPALVLSPDLVDEHSPVVIVAAITLRRAENVYPVEALVLPPEGGLKERSKVLLMQLRSLDKRCLGGILGDLQVETLRRVDETPL